MMMGMQYILSFIILLALHANALADDGLRVAVFGDSLVSGYQLQEKDAFPARLEKKIKEAGFQNVTVVNMGLPGETSTGGLDRVNTVVAARPDIALVALGGNDALRGTRPEIIHRNVGMIIGRLQQQHIYVILLGAPAPAAQGPDYAQRLAAMYAGLASFYTVPFYPSLTEGIADKPEYTLADGYHPNAQGVDIMVEKVYPLVDAGLRWKWGVKYQP